MLLKNEDMFLNNQDPGMESSEAAFLDYEQVIQRILTYYLFWCWRRNILALGVNTMPADALAPKVARASAGMVWMV